MCQTFLSHYASLSECSLLIVIDVILSEWYSFINISCIIIYIDPYDLTFVLDTRSRHMIFLFCLPLKNTTPNLN